MIKFLCGVLALAILIILQYKTPFLNLKVSHGGLILKKTTMILIRCLRTVPMHFQNTVMQSALVALALKMLMKIIY